MKATRLEAFSDGVIAIIITIMVLEMKAPRDSSPAALLALLPVFLSYALSFLIIAIYWVNHHHLIHLVQKVDASILWLNIHLLFWLSLVPFVTAYLGERYAIPLSVALYAAVAIGCSIAFSLLRGAIARRHRHDSQLVALHTKMQKKNVIALAIYVAAFVAAFIYVPAALSLLVFPAFMYFMPDRRAENR